MLLRPQCWQQKPVLVQDVAQTPVAESIDLASMPIEDSYDGPHLEGILSTRKLRFCQILHDKISSDKADSCFALMEYIA